MKGPPISFFVIGAARSGTTSIYRALAGHPRIYEAPVKEPRFFAEHWRKGWDWYSAIYADAPPDAVCGDFSPSYSNATDDNRAAERIARFYPGARILYMVRNPIDCALSNWRMAAELAGRTPPFRDAFEGEWTIPILQRCLFFKQLGFYRQHFADEQILVIPLEAVRLDPAGWLNRVQRHLGLDERELHFPKANASNRKAKRPPIPDTALAERNAFLARVRPDALALLDHLGLPESFWSLSPNSRSWAVRD